MPDMYPGVVGSALTKRTTPKPVVDLNLERLLVEEEMVDLALKRQNLRTLIDATQSQIDALDNQIESKDRLLASFAEVLRYVDRWT